MALGLPLTCPMEQATQRRTWLLFGALSVYVVLQFVWWAYLLISQESRIAEMSGSVPGMLGEGQAQRRVWMVVGEGSVLLLFLLVMLFLTYRAVRRDLRLARRQRNFLLAVTHELRTPIASLKLQFQTLKRPGLSAEARMELEQRSSDELERLGAITEKVLLASDPGGNEPGLRRDPTDLASLSRQLVEQAQRTHASGHRVELHAPGSFPFITDPDAFRSVLENLLENAAKYSPRGSTISVDLSGGPHGAVIRVTDQGPGIPQADRAHIFERFFRGGNEEVRQAKGTGLGLYIVQRLVRRLGGQVHVEDGPVGGATFAVHLPAL
jgi:signal transduction histidine kinase